MRRISCARQLRATHTPRSPRSIPALALGLAGAAAGGSAGTLIGSLIGLGIPTEHAQRYEHALREGRILVSVEAKDQSAADDACQTLRGSGAREVASYSPVL